jgi:hypothetical protein
MKRLQQPNVLFLNIGWAEQYDGRHRIQGNHEDIRNQEGNPSVLGEGKAFLPDISGLVRCVVGMGKVTPSSSIDVVFVARNPAGHRHEIVGIYFEPSFSYSPWTNRRGRTETWAEASTRQFKGLPGNQRGSTKWPRGRSMRRWVRRRGIIHYPTLFDQYALLI